MFKLFKPFILVVDDEKDFADNLVKTIKSSGRYKAKAVYSALDAFLEIERNKWFLDLAWNRIACIILEKKMPEMDGMEFLEKLWTLRYNQYAKRGFIEQRDREYIPVIILSAYEDQEKWANTPQKLEYLKKPFKEEELFATLDKIMRSSTDDWITMQRALWEKRKQRGFS